MAGINCGSLNDFVHLVVSDQIEGSTTDVTRVNPPATPRLLMVSLLPEIPLYVFWFVASGVGTEKLSVSCIKAQSTYSETKVVLVCLYGLLSLLNISMVRQAEFKFSVSICNMICDIASSLAGKP